MRISEFRRIHKNEAVSIPLSKISLTENCHIKGIQNNHAISKLQSEPLCIVRKNTLFNENSDYSLVVGYRDYITAKNSGAEEIKAIIVGVESRKGFYVALDQIKEMWELADIHEPGKWKTPNPNKVGFCEKNYRESGSLGKDIVISADGTVIDGYSAVCAARNMGLKTVPVCVKAF